MLVTRSNKFFGQLLTMFCISQMALGLFRCSDAVGRSMIIVNGQIWCSHNGVVVKILKGFVSSMMSNLVVADGKNFTNKSLHSTASTRISFAGVPGEVANKFSGYRCVFF